jgi:acetyl esterase/lipase
MKKGFLILLFIINAVHVPAQQFIPLWPEGKKPNFNGMAVTDSLYNERLWRVGTPGLYTFPVTGSENTGTAVLICPGGGYERVNYLYNGFNLARWYNTIGVSAFVLIYRLPHQSDLQQRQLAPLQDAQRAMRIIRTNAARWNIKSNKIGVMGVSSGGHVASTLATHITDLSAIKDSMDATGFLPDFMVLLSPVISMGKYAHHASRKYFIGPDSSKAMIENYSNELQVSSATPPTFIVHASNDSSVSVRNSVQFYNALLDKKVNASIHIFPKGGHGIRMDDNPGSTDYWLNLLEAWLKEMDLVVRVPFK